MTHPPKYMPAVAAWMLIALFLGIPAVVVGIVLALLL